MGTFIWDILDVLVWDDTSNCAVLLLIGNVIVVIS